VSDVENTPPSRVQRSLTFMIAAVIGLSVLAFVALLIGMATQTLDYDNQLWQVVFFVPYFGLPIGFVLIFVLLIISIRRRRQDARGSK
jgi:TRAP-type C4-dicarboxylate transport system permease small subunit